MSWGVFTPYDLAKSIHSCFSSASCCCSCANCSAARRLSRRHLNLHTRYVKAVAQIHTCTRGTHARDCDCGHAACFNQCLECKMRQQGMIKLIPTMVLPCCRCNCVGAAKHPAAAGGSCMLKPLQLQYSLCTSVATCEQQCLAYCNHHHRPPQLCAWTGVWAAHCHLLLTLLGGYHQQHGSRRVPRGRNKIVARVLAGDPCVCC